MSNSKRITRRARKSSKHNTIILLPDGSTKSLWINPVLLDDLAYCHEETRKPLSVIFNEALDWYNQCMAPALIQSAQMERNQAA